MYSARRHRDREISIQHMCTCAHTTNTAYGKGIVFIKSKGFSAQAVRALVRLLTVTMLYTALPMRGHSRPLSQRVSDRVSTSILAMGRGSETIGAQALDTCAAVAVTRINVWIYTYRVPKIRAAD